MYHRYTMLFKLNFDDVFFMESPLSCTLDRIVTPAITLRSKQGSIIAGFAQCMYTCVTGFISIGANMNWGASAYFVRFTEDCGTSIALFWCILMCVVVTFFKICRHVSYFKINQRSMITSTYICNIIIINCGNR